MFIFVVCALLSGVLAQQCYNLDVECDTWTEYCHLDVRLSPPTNMMTSFQN